MLRVLVAAGCALLIVLAACSSSRDGNGDADPALTPTGQAPTPPPASPTDATTVVATGADTDEDEPLAPTATHDDDPTAAEATGSPRATTTGSATRTPTGEPLPEGGDELMVEGEAVSRIIPGGDNGRTLYGISGEQLWRSNNGGRTWSEAGEGEFGPMIVALNQPNVLYSGDKGSCGRGFSSFPFQRSTDAGRNWHTVAANADVEPLLAYESQNGAYLYATNCGLDVSDDGGDSWSRIVELNGEEVFSVTTERSDPMAQLLVVAATEGGTGRLFLFDLSSPGNPLLVGALAQFWGDAAVDWMDARIVIAHAHQVGVSDDSGQNWRWTRDGLEDATYEHDPLFDGIPEGETDPFPGFDFARIDPTNRDRIWIGGNRGAYLSIDGGETWELVGEVEPVTGLAISTVSDRVFISYESGTRLWSLSGAG